MKKRLIACAALVFACGCSASDPPEGPPVPSADNRVSCVRIGTAEAGNDAYEARFTYDAQQRIADISFDGLETTLSYGDGILVAESAFGQNKQTTTFYLQDNRIVGAAWTSQAADVRATFGYEGQSLVRFESEWTEVDTGTLYDRMLAEAAWADGCLVSWNIPSRMECKFRRSSCPNDTNIDLSVLLTRNYMPFEEVAPVAMLRLFGAPSSCIMENADTERYAYAYTYRHDDAGRLVGGTVEVRDRENPQASYTDTYTVEYVAP